MLSVPVHLPGYKPEEPGMEGGGRTVGETGRFSPVWGVYIQCTSFEWTAGIDSIFSQHAMLHKIAP